VGSDLRRQRFCSIRTVGQRGMSGSWARSASLTIVQVSGHLCTGSLLCMCST
jgi:hypothetical protein